MKEIKIKSGEDNDVLKEPNFKTNNQVNPKIFSKLFEYIINFFQIKII